MVTRKPGVKEPWSMPGRYQVSPVNFNEEVRSLFDFPDQVVIHDNTIQKMDLAPGARMYSPQEKVEVARLLDEIGVQELDCAPVAFVGTPRYESVVDGLRAICQAGLKMHLRVKIGVDYPKFAKGDYSDIDEAVDWGVEGIDVSLGGRQSATFNKAGLDQEQREKVVSENLEYVRRKGVDAGVSASDIGSLDMDALIQDMNVWLDHGAERLCLSDHMSSVSPEAARWLIRYLRKGMKREIPIVYHPHNRYGLGTAAAIAVASAGGWPETTVNGFADNGLASFEEVVVALETLYGVDTGIKLGRLQELSRAVERITGFKSHPLKPVVGDAMWAPAGSYQYAELRGEGRGCVDSHMSPFEAKMVGAEVNWKWSINTVAPESLEIKLTQLALSHSANDVAAVRSALLEDLAAKDQFPAWLSDAEVDQVCRQVLGKGKR